MGNTFCPLEAGREFPGDPVIFSGLLLWKRRGFGDLVEDARIAPLVCRTQIKRNERGHRCGGRPVAFGVLCKDMIKRKKLFLIFNNRSGPTCPAPPRVGGVWSKSLIRTRAQRMPVPWPCSPDLGVAPLRPGVSASRFLLPRLGGRCLRGKLLFQPAAPLREGDSCRTAPFARIHQLDPGWQRSGD